VLRPGLTPEAPSHGAEGALLDAVHAAWHAAGPSARVCVAFSGGLDSTVLLRAAAETRPAAACLEAIHVHHGLQPDADRWLEHCRRSAAAAGVALAERRVDAGGRGSEETRAREARYAVFADTLTAGGELWLAHHGDDQLETLLLHLLQGRGLYGMPRQRPLAQGRLRRPLLDLPRATLVAWGRHRGLSWVKDPSNRDSAHDRAFLRTRVVPLLEERFSTLGLRLRSLAEEHEAALGGLARLAALDPAANALALTALGPLGAAERVAVVRAWLHLGRRPLPPRRALQAFLEQLAAAPGAQPRLTLADGSTLRRFRGRLWWVPSLPPPAGPQVLAAGGAWRLPAGELRVEPAADGLALREPLRLVPRRGGETLRCGGHRRSLKTLLQAAGIAPWLRPYWPLIEDADGLAVVPEVAVRDGLLPKAGAAPDAVPDSVPDAVPNRLRVSWRLDSRLR